MALLAEPFSRESCFEFELAMVIRLGRRLVVGEADASVHWVVPALQDARNLVVPL